MSCFTVRLAFFATLPLFALIAGCSCSDEDARASGGQGGDSAEGGVAGVNGGAFSSGGSSRPGGSGSGGNTDPAGAAGIGDVAGAAGIPALSCASPGQRECVDQQTERECREGLWQTAVCPTGCAKHHCVRAVSIAAGHAQTCAVLDDGSARCWGNGAYGLLGNAHETKQALPVSVLAADGSELAHVEQLASGAQHGCALLSAGDLRCWGHDSFGQLGNARLGKGERSDVPVAVVSRADATLTLEGVVEVAARGYQSCARLAGGGVSCWGKGLDGQLGSGQVGAGADRAFANPVLLAGNSAQPLESAKQITLGYWHGCARIASGQVRCWGNAESGQLGDGVTQTAAKIATAVTVVDTTDTPIQGAISIAAGYFHTCAVLSDGHAVCWGEGARGQLGNGRSGAQASSRAAVPVLTTSGAPLTGVLQLAAGLAHTCALLTDGGVQCWGDARSGQLGDGRGGADLLADHPVSVLAAEASSHLLEHATQISAGLNHTCVLTQAGVVKCWGRNNLGQLTGTTDAFAPRDVSWREQP